MEPTLFYLLSLLRPEISNESKPYINDLIDVIYLLLENSKEKDTEAFNKLNNLNIKFPKNEIIEYLLGRCWQFDRGVPNDPLKKHYAYQLFTSSSSQGFSPALSALHACHFNGIDIPGHPDKSVAADPNKGIQILRQAIFIGGVEGNIRPDAFSIALLQYGLLLYSGHSNPKLILSLDKKKGFELIKLAADKGHAPAQTIIWQILNGEFVEEGQIEDPKSDAAAIVSEANKELGLQYLRLAVRQRQEEAICHLRKQLCTKWTLLAKDVSDAELRKTFTHSFLTNPKNKKIKELISIQVEFLDLFTLIKEMLPKSPLLKERFGSPEALARFEVLEKEFIKYQRDIFCLQDKTERKQSIEGYAALGDRVSLAILGFALQGRPHDLELTVDGPSRIVSLDCPIDVPATIQTYSIGEARGSFTSAFNLAWLYEYGLNVKLAKFFEIPVSVGAEHLFEMVEIALPETKTGQDQTPKPAEEQELVQLSEQDEEAAQHYSNCRAFLEGFLDEYNKSLQQYAPTVQSECVDLIKALEHYRKAEELFALRLPLHPLERRWSVSHDVTGTCLVTHTYLFDRIKRLSQVEKLRDEVASTLEACGHPLPKGPTNLNNLVATYVGYKGFLRQKKG